MSNADEQMLIKAKPSLTFIPQHLTGSLGVANTFYVMP